MNWYNYKKLYSVLGYKTPAEKELEIKINNYTKVAQELIPNLPGSPYSCLTNQLIDLFGSKNKVVCSCQCFY